MVASRCSAAHAHAHETPPMKIAIPAALLLLGAPLAGVAGCAARATPPSGSVASPVARPDPALAARIDSAVRAAVERRSVPAAAVALLRRDTLVFAGGYGVADRERGTPVTAETIFQIASTTKPFTAMAVIMLAEEGKLDLDAPAARYLTWLPARYNGVTVRPLLTHTSGVVRDLRRANVDEFTAEEFRRRLEERPASFAPGARWEYSNTGYTLLSLVVEAVSGREFGMFLRERIFEPLGMHHTGYRAPERDDGRHAAGYDLVDGQLVRAPHVFSGWGNSGIESTVLDLARWAAALQRGALLRAESYRVMLERGRLGSGEAADFEFGGARSGYGFGWFLTSYRGAELRTHGGAIAGFSSIVNWFPRDGWTVIVLSNGKQGADGRGQADGIATAIAEALHIGEP